MAKILQVVFDCDGVLLESANIKTVAFGKTVEVYGRDAKDQFLAYHTKHFGVSRMTKLKWFCEEVLQSSDSALPDTLAENFAKIVQEELMSCPFVEGVEDCLKELHGKMPLFVCSGTPQKELIDILNKRGLAQYFTAIYGTPPEKNILLKNLVDENGISAQNTLMVGDAQTDLEAANFVDTQFYGRGIYFKDKSVHYSDTMNELLTFINMSV